MKKKILFVYYEMTIGGSTTSLLSLLNELDFEKYDVDLLLYQNEGELLPLIPEKVNLLEQASVPQSKIKKMIKSVCNGTLLRAYINRVRFAGNAGNWTQSMAYCQAGYSRKIEEEYDVVIGYMELWADVFANLKIKAKRKISWIHTDYQKADLVPQIDRCMLSKSTYIANVSQECCRSFKNLFPELAERVVFVPNILSASILRKRSKEDFPSLELNPSMLNLLTVCRLDNASKAIDRGINIMKKLTDEGYALRWYIIGDGVDRLQIEEQIKQLQLMEQVVLLGAKTNPYPYYQLFDAFMLISRFEGKPMSVTEAQILGLPVLVTNYNSAKEQVESGVDGIICENNEEAIEGMLRSLLNNPILLEKMRTNVKEKKYSNEKDIEIIHGLIDN